MKKYLTVASIIVFTVGMVIGSIALAEMPGPARKLASFLVLLIDATSQACPVSNHDTNVRCRTDACTGSIRTALSSLDEEISWHCAECGHNGVIRNWQGTKWIWPKFITGGRWHLRNWAVSMNQYLIGAT